MFGRGKAGALYLVAGSGVSLRVSTTNSTFSNNSAALGSFLAAPGAGSVELEMESVVAVGNNASDSGGAFLGSFVRSNWTRCTFRWNVAAVFGAALRVVGEEAATEASGCLFESNRANKVRACDENHAAGARAEDFPALKHALIRPLSQSQQTHDIVLCSPAAHPSSFL